MDFGTWVFSQNPTMAPKRETTLRVRVYDPIIPKPVIFIGTFQMKVFLNLK
jgi:hypothetical protein